MSQSYVKECNKLGISTVFSDEIDREEEHISGSIQIQKEESRSIIVTFEQVMEELNQQANPQAVEGMCGDYQQDGFENGAMGGERCAERTCREGTD